jgi:hypothetical protein
LAFPKPDQEPFFSSISSQKITCFTYDAVFSLSKLHKETQFPHIFTPSTLACEELNTMLYFHIIPHNEDNPVFKWIKYLDQKHTRVLMTNLSIQCNRNLIVSCFVEMSDLTDLLSEKKVDVLEASMPK